MMLLLLRCVRFQLLTLNWMLLLEHIIKWNSDGLLAVRVSLPIEMETWWLSEWHEGVYIWIDSISRCLLWYWRAGVPRAFAWRIWRNWMAPRCWAVASRCWRSSGGSGMFGCRRIIRRLPMKPIDVSKFLWHNAKNFPLIFFLPRIRWRPDTLAFTRVCSGHNRLHWIRKWVH